MFAPSYFAPTYFAPTYWPQGGAESGVPPSCGYVWGQPLWGGTPSCGAGPPAFVPRLNAVAGLRRLN